MRYYAAPMEGLTDLVWRQAHQRYFGGADRYYAPFPLAARKPGARQKEDGRASAPGQPRRAL